MTEIPTWLRWLIGAFIPIVTAAVGLTNAAVNREVGRREEAMRLLRCAAERAVEPNNDTANLMGVEALHGLSKGKMLSRDDRRILWAITQAVLAKPEAAYSHSCEPPNVDLQPNGEGA